MANKPQRANDPEVSPTEGISSGAVEKAVMKDPVVKAALKHGGRESPGQLSFDSSRQSEARLRSAGQRATSIVWEGTQMRLALMTVGGFMVTEAFVIVVLAIILARNWSALSGNPTAIAALVAVLTASLGAITSTASLVIGFYFGRTNHQRVGGVGGDTAGSR